MEEEHEDENEVVLVLAQFLCPGSGGGWPNSAYKAPQESSDSQLLHHALSLSSFTRFHRNPIIIDFSFRIVSSRIIFGMASLQPQHSLHGADDGELEFNSPSDNPPAVSSNEESTMDLMSIYDPSYDYSEQDIS